MPLLGVGDDMRSPCLECREKQSKTKYERFCSQSCAARYAIRNSIYDTDIYCRLCKQWSDTDGHIKGCKNGLQEGEL